MVMFSKPVHAMCTGFLFVQAPHSRFVADATDLAPTWPALRSMRAVTALRPRAPRLTKVPESAQQKCQ
jgi:hypothetical protein